MPGTPAGFTEFELLTAAALWLFRERGVEIAVLEVGLGGRWDATSVVNPSVAVITGVGLDHTAILGDTLEAIAAEKAAIIRPASAPVLGPGTDGLDSVFLRAAEVGVDARARRARGPASSRRSPRSSPSASASCERPSSPDGHTLVSVDGVHAHYPALALSGPAYQAANVATAVAAAEAALGRALHVERAQAALRAARASRPLRALRSRPPGHRRRIAQPAGGRRSSPSPSATRFPTRPRARCCFSASSPTRTPRGIVEALAPVVGGVAVTQSDSPRAMPAEALAELVTDVTGAPPTAVFASIAEALDVLLATAHDGLIITGSITTAGEARALLRNT